MLIPRDPTAGPQEIHISCACRGYACPSMPAMMAGPSIRYRRLVLSRGEGAGYGAISTRAEMKRAIFASSLPFSTLSAALDSMLDEKQRMCWQASIPLPRLLPSCHSSPEWEPRMRLSSPVLAHSVSWGGRSTHTTHFFSTAAKPYGSHSGNIFLGSCVGRTTTCLLAL